MIITPGITGRCGKCPGKNGSFMVTFLIAWMLLPLLHSSTRSTSRKVSRWGSRRMTPMMSMESGWLILLILGRILLRRREANVFLDRTQPLRHSVEPLDASHDAAPHASLLGRHTGRVHARL